MVPRPGDWDHGSISDLTNMGVLRKRTCRNISPQVQVSHFFNKCAVVLVPKRSASQRSTSCSAGSSFRAELLSSPLLSFPLLLTPTPPCWGASSCGVLVLGGHISVCFGTAPRKVAQALFLCRVVPLMHPMAQGSKKPRSFCSRPRPSITSFSSRSGVSGKMPSL